MRFVVLAFFGACFTPTTPTDTTQCTDTDCGTTTTDDDTGTAKTTDALAPEAPSIDKLVLSAPELTEGGQVTVTATVSDSDGLSTVVGGNVRGPGGEVITAFSLVSDGVYEAAVSWVDIHGALGIEFEAATLDLGLQVAFFDNSSLTGLAPLSLLATCGGLPNYACSGKCVDAANDADHCGGCNNACKGLECNAGTCDVAWSACEPFAGSKHGNCAELCAATGEACADACESEAHAFNTMVRWSDPKCGGGSDYDFEVNRCDDTYEWSSNGSTFSAVQCCCTSGAVFGG